MNDVRQINLNDTIKTFLDQFKMISDVDVNNDFDYFTYVVNFIKKNSSNDDFEYNYSKMQTNKIDVSISVVDIISDYIFKSQFELVNNVLDTHVREFDSDKTFPKRQRERFVNAVVGAFYKYLNESKGYLNDLMDIAVDGLSTRNNDKMGRIKNDGYDAVIGLV